MNKLDLSKIKWTGWCILYDGTPIPDGGIIPGEEEGEVKYSWQVDYFITPKENPTKEKACTLIRRDCYVARFESVANQDLVYLDVGYRVYDDGSIKPVWILTTKVPPDHYEEVFEDLKSLEEKLQQLRLNAVYDEATMAELVSQLEG